MDGRIYRLALRIDRGDHCYDLDQFILRLSDVRKSFIHICSDEAGTELILTVPAQIGPEIVSQSIASAIDAAKNSMDAEGKPNIHTLKDHWKSTLSWPDHLANAILSSYEYVGGSLIR
jgi:hypothetical protein